MPSTASETRGSHRTFLTFTFTVELAIQNVLSISKNHTGVVCGEPSRRKVVNHAHGASAIFTRPVSTRQLVQQRDGLSAAGSDRLPVHVKRNAHRDGHGAAGGTACSAAVGKCIAAVGSRMVS